MTPDEATTSGGRNFAFPGIAEGFAQAIKAHTASRLAVEPYVVVSPVIINHAADIAGHIVETAARVAQAKFAANCILEDANIDARIKIRDAERAAATLKERAEADAAALVKDAAEVAAELVRVAAEAAEEIATANAARSAAVLEHELRKPPA